MPECPNCSAELGGEYCAACGQKRVRPEELSARHFARELFDELSTLHAKFTIFRTLRTLLWPGALTEAFLAGRRRPYLNPIQTYLVCAALFFFAAPFAGFNLESLIKGDQSGDLVALVSAHETSRGLAPEHLNARFDLRLQSVYTISMGLGVIALALVQQLLFARRGWPFGAHLIFALHYISFLYLITIAAGATRRAGVSEAIASGAAVCLVTAYLFLALRRVYAESTGTIILKAGILIGVVLAVNYFASLGAILLTLSLV